MAKHYARIDIDWYRRDPYERPIMLSWRDVECNCDTPWSHY
jgi:hypothetical protein